MFNGSSAEYVVSDEPTVNLLGEVAYKGLMRTSVGSAIVLVFLCACVTRILFHDFLC